MEGPNCHVQNLLVLNTRNQNCINDINQGRKVQLRKEKKPRSSISCTCGRTIQSQRIIIHDMLLRLNKVKRHIFSYIEIRDDAPYYISWPFILFYFLLTPQSSYTFARPKTWEALLESLLRLSNVNPTWRQPQILKRLFLCLLVLI